MSSIPNLPRGQIYIATPFTLYPEGHLAAFQEAARITSHLTGLGLDVFSPIVHGYPLCTAMSGHLDPVDHALWTWVNAPHMARSSSLIVAKMTGWQESKGVAAEIFDFGKRDKPVFTLDPATFEIEPMGFELAEVAGAAS